MRGTVLGPPIYRPHVSGGGVEAKSSPSSGEPCLAPSQQPPLLFRSAVQVTSSRSRLRSDRANQRHRTRPPHLPSRSVGGGAEAKSSPSRGAQLPVFHTNALSCMTAVPRTGDLCLARGHSSGRPWPPPDPRSCGGGWGLRKIKTASTARFLTEPLSSSPIGPRVAPYIATSHLVTTSRCVGSTTTSLL